MTLEPGLEAAFRYTVTEADTATTVGTRVELDHLAPSPVGAGLEVDAVLERVAGRRLELAVRLREGDRPVARGRVVRVVVDAAAFVRDAAVAASEQVAYNNPAARP
jgi:predicted thioesterase